MFINRCFNPTFPLLLLTTSRGLRVAAIIALLLIFGCGETAIDNQLAGSIDEDRQTENVVPMSTPYYPMKLGSRWVYRNSSGSEWTREVTDASFLGISQSAYSFSYNPPLEDNEFDFFQARSNIATPGRIIRLIKIGEIRIPAQTIDIRYNIKIQIEENNGRTVNRFGFVGSRTYNIHGFERSEFVWLRPPLVPGKTWQVFSIDLRGRRNIHNFSHLLEAHSVISARINEELQTVVTPAGRFEDCLEIEYYETLSAESTEIEIELIPEKYKEERALLETRIHETASTEFLKLMPNIPLGTLWLAPEVGPIKIQKVSGVSELIAFDIKK